MKHSICFEIKLTIEFKIKDKNDLFPASENALENIQSSEMTTFNF